jgi:hypothetical protein
MLLTGRAGLVAVAAVSLLAVVETATALIAPRLAPTDADWAAAAGAVRAGFRPGDLIVAAPAWADPILRVHLGDLIPPEVEGRLDDARFGRVWEVGQRSARSPAAAGEVAFDERFGALRVRRVERSAPAMRYDFVARWADAQVSRVDRAGATVSCRNIGDRIQCPDVSYSSVRRQIVEVDTRLRMALVTQPVGGWTVVVEFPAVPLGRELVVATGLHNVWMRKSSNGPVELRVRVGGEDAAAFTTQNDDGWKEVRIDTAARAGQVVPVRFEISSPEPRDRYFAFAAEARG